MSTSHQAAVPAAVYAYFGLAGGHPTISQVFYPDRGWKRYPGFKRVSHTEITRLRRAGATSVALTPEGGDRHRRLVDFRIVTHHKGSLV